MAPKSSSSRPATDLAAAFDLLWGEKKKKRQSATFEEDDGFVFKRIPLQSSVSQRANGKSRVPSTSSRTSDSKKVSRSINGSRTKSRVTNLNDRDSTSGESNVRKKKKETIVSKQRVRSSGHLDGRDEEEDAEEIIRNNEREPEQPSRRKRQIFSFDDERETEEAEVPPPTQRKKKIVKRIVKKKKPVPEVPTKTRIKPVIKPQIKKVISKKRPIQPVLKPVPKPVAVPVSVPESPEPYVEIPQEEYQEMNDFGSGSEHYEHADTSLIPLNNSPKPSSNETYDLSENRRTSFYRRSSLGNRGKRLSSIGNGYQAEPHSDIPPQEFFRHLDASLPEAQRVRQLLVWSTKRAIANSQDKLRSLTGRQEDIAMLIQNSFLSDLMNGTIEPDWVGDLNRKDTSINSSLNEPINIAPHPENQMNLKIKSELEERLRNLKNEERVWKSIKEESNQISNIDINSLNVAETETYKRVKSAGYGVESKTKVFDTINKISRSVELLKFAVHKSKTSIEAVEILTDDASRKAFTKLQQSIEVNDEGEKVQSEDLLKSLTKLAFLGYVEGDDENSTSNKETDNE